MPTQGLHELDTEQIGRILYLATASRSLKKNMPDKSHLMFGEVQQDFCRTMNLIIMEKFMEASPEDRKDMIPDGLTLPPKQPPKKVLYYG